MPTDLVPALAAAIARKEGYPLPRSLARRNNNPGNLRAWGSQPVRDGFAVFASPEDGFRALHTQIRRNIARGLTLVEFFGGKPGVYPGYAPAADRNDPLQYARFVGRVVGIPIDVPLNRLQAGAA